MEASPEFPIHFLKIYSMQMRVGLNSGAVVVRAISN
jgi:class 3 adenylate cyclase